MSSCDSDLFDPKNGEGVIAPLRVHSRIQTKIEASSSFCVGKINDNKEIFYRRGAIKTKPVHAGIWSEGKIKNEGVVVVFENDLGYLDVITGEEFKIVSCKTENSLLNGEDYIELGGKIILLNDIVFAVDFKDNKLVKELRKFLLSK